jgi:hypothetical protein
MSRGLGALQRRILETLDEARAAMPRYRGVSMAWEYVPRTNRFTNRGYLWVHVGAGQLVELAPGVYDLRCSAAYLAEQDGHTPQGWQDVSFTAAFARATRGLIQRGILVRLHEIPGVLVVRGQPARTATSVVWPSRQLRFVTLSANPVGLTLRGNQIPEDGVYR